MKKVLSLMLSLSVALSSVNGFAQEKVESQENMESDAVKTNSDGADVVLLNAGQTILNKIAQEEALIESIKDQIKQSKKGQGVIAIELPNELLFGAAAVYGSSIAMKLERKFTTNSQNGKAGVALVGGALALCVSVAYGFKIFETVTVFYAHEADIFVLNSRLNESEIRLQLLKESIGLNN